MKTLDFIVPVFNEEENVSLLHQKINEFSKVYEGKIQINIFFIDDGSTDNTFSKLIKMREESNNIKIIKLTRNFGKENALTAGLDFTNADACIIFDADFQDPLTAADEMIQKWNEGHDSIIGKRIDRSEDTFIKRFSSSLFYKFHNSVSEEKIPENVGDFRLISKKIILSIRQLREKNRFMKGIYPWVGNNDAVVEYKREKRLAGNTKFNFSKLFSLAREGITSFSIFPLRISQFLGLAGLVFSIILSSIVLVQSFFGEAPEGIPIIILLILFFGSLNLLSLGIIGEYVGKTYIETKNRPIYVVDQKYIDDL